MIAHTSMDILNIRTPLHSHPNLQVAVQTTSDIDSDHNTMIIPGGVYRRRSFM
jgi:hypothetical protein